MSEQEKDLLYLFRKNTLFYFLFYWNSKTGNKKQQGWFLGPFLAPLVASLVQPVITSVLKGVSERGVRRAGRGYNNKNF